MRARPRAHTTRARPRPRTRAHDATNAPRPDSRRRTGWGRFGAPRSEAAPRSGESQAAGADAGRARPRNSQTSGLSKGPAQPFPRSSSKGLLQGANARDSIQAAHARGSSEEHRQGAHPRGARGSATGGPARWGRRDPGRRGDAGRRDRQVHGLPAHPRRLSEERVQPFPKGLSEAHIQRACPRIVLENPLDKPLGPWLDPRGRPKERIPRAPRGLVTGRLRRRRRSRGRDRRLQI